MSKKKRLNDRVKIAVFITALIGIDVYILFFAYIPKMICIFDYSSEIISEEMAAKECPEVIVSDYDREFLDRLIEDERIAQLENSDGHNSLVLTADEDGLPRYTPREDENYTVRAFCEMYGILPLSASIQFEDEGVLYKERLFISVDREDNGNEYTKCVMLIRADGKFINEYECYNGKYIKETYRYGLINHIKGIIDGIMSV
ncbi:MAG: hypothetical protein ACI4JK_06820 [Oscillospiraceae bacterium]